MPHYRADCGVYDTGFNPYDVGAPLALLGAGSLGAIFDAKMARMGELIRQGKPPEEARRLAGLVAPKGTFGAFKVAGKAVGRVAKQVAPIVAQALPYIQKGMAAMGPIGMVAAGAAGALAGAVQGKSLEDIAWAAAEGASPPGIDRAVAAAKALRHGTPVLQVALSQARASMPGGSAAQRAFDLGVSAVKGGSKGMMANARNQLTTAVQKAAFDSAVGTIAKAAGHLPSDGRGPRIAFIQKRPKIPMSLLRPGTQAAVNILRRQPILRRMQDRDIASRYNLPLRRVIEARGIVEASGVIEVGAPDTLSTYVLRSGDTGSGIAKRFTGDANRWRELPSVNKRGMGGYTGSKDMVVKQTTTTIGGKKVPVTLLDPFYSGLKINVPPGWVGPGIVEVLPEVIITPGPTTLPPEIPPQVLPPIVTAPPITTPPIVTPPITTPTVTTPPIAMPEPFPSIPGQTIPGQTIPGATIPGTTVPVGLPSVTPTPGSPTIPTPTVPTTPAEVEAKKKQDATALAFGVAAAAAVMLL